MPDTQLDAERAHDPEQPIAWRAVLQETPVRSSEGEHVGHIVDLLGSDEEDIFMLQDRCHQTSPDRHGSRSRRSLTDQHLAEQRRDSSPV